MPSFLFTLPTSSPALGDASPEAASASAGAFEQGWADSVAQPSLKTSDKTSFKEAMAAAAAQADDFADAITASSNETTNDAANRSLSSLRLSSASQNQLSGDRQQDLNAEAAEALLASLVEHPCVDCQHPAPDPAATAFGSTEPRSNTIADQDFPQSDPLLSQVALSQVSVANAQPAAPVLSTANEKSLLSDPNAVGERTRDRVSQPTASSDQTADVNSLFQQNAATDASRFDAAATNTDPLTDQAQLTGAGDLDPRVTTSQSDLDPSNAGSANATAATVQNIFDDGLPQSVGQQGGALSSEQPINLVTAAANAAQVAQPGRGQTSQPAAEQTTPLTSANPSELPADSTLATQSTQNDASANVGTTAPNTSASTSTLLPNPRSDSPATGSDPSALQDPIPVNVIPNGIEASLPTAGPIEFGLPTVAASIDATPVRSKASRNSADQNESVDDELAEDQLTGDALLEVDSPDVVSLIDDAPPSTTDEANAQPSQTPLFETPGSSSFSSRTDSGTSFDPTINNITSADASDVGGNNIQGTLQSLGETPASARTESLMARSQTSAYATASAPTVQVAEALQTKLAPFETQPTQSISLQLNPPELGHIQINVEQSTDQIVAQIVATEFGSTELLLQDKNLLLDALADLGFEDTTLDISYGNSSEQEPEPDSEQQNAQNHISPYQQHAKTNQSSDPDAVQIQTSGVNLLA